MHYGGDTRIGPAGEGLQDSCIQSSLLVLYVLVESLTFTVSSDWTEFNLLTPSAVILPDPANPYPSTNTNTNTNTPTPTCNGERSIAAITSIKLLGKYAGFWQFVVLTSTHEGFLLTTTALQSTSPSWELGGSVDSG